MTFQRRLIMSCLGVLLLASLVSCSSKSKKAETAQPEESTSHAEAEPAPSPAKGKSRGRETVPSAPVSGNYSSLAQATRAGKPEAVREEVGKILSSNPTDPVALNVLAVTYIRAKKFGAAKMMLLKGLEKNPDSAPLFNTMGVVDLSEHEPQLALSDFKKAYKADPKNPDVLANLGGFYVRNGDCVKAQPMLEQAYRQSRSRPVAINYAVCLRISKSYDQAHKIYQELIAQNPKDTTAIFNDASLQIAYMNRSKDGLSEIAQLRLLEPPKEMLSRVNTLEKKAKTGLK